MNATPAQVVDAYFKAMQAGPAGQTALLALFAEEAVYVEPFAGQARRHEGKAAIRACFAESFQRTPPALTLQVDRVDVDGAQVVAEWTCDSPAFPAPVRGRDRYVVRDGLIYSLEVRFL